MTQIERYQHLVNHWTNVTKQCDEEYKQAFAQREYFKQMLVRAEIAEQIAADAANDKSP